MRLHGIVDGVGGVQEDLSSQNETWHSMQQNSRLLIVVRNGIPQFLQVLSKRGLWRVDWLQFGLIEDGQYNPLFRLMSDL